MGREIGSVYLHIGNSGVTVSVNDEGWGPTLVITSSSFGNNTTEQKVHIDYDGLDALARLFAHASAYDEYSQPYCHAASFSDGNPPHLFEDMLPEHGTACCGVAGSDGCEESDGRAGCGDCFDGLDGEVDKEVEVAFCGRNGYDAQSMHQGDFGTCNSRIYYAQQFVDTETHDFAFSGQDVAFYLKHAPFCPGTMTGKVEINGVPVQSFISYPCGEIKFKPAGESEFIVEKGWVSRTGLISLYFSKFLAELAQIRFTCSYEHDLKNEIK